MPAECRQSDAGDETHGSMASFDFVIPGWSEGPDPESRDSPMCIAHLRFASSMRPRMTTKFPSRIISSNISIRLRQAQHLLGNKAENELRADRGDARDQG